MARLILTEVLKKKGMSKYRFAKKMGMKYNNVFKMFHEDYDPRFSTLAKIAQALGVKIKDLYRE